MLKTLGKCSWEDIEVGEVFASNGCWCIFQKLLGNKVFALATTIMYEEDDLMDNFDWCWLSRTNDVGIWEKTFTLYKLPLSIQRLWRTD